MKTDPINGLNICNVKYYIYYKYIFKKQHYYILQYFFIVFKVFLFVVVGFLSIVEVYSRRSNP